jgi:Dolichyl-phosphate-mannose-protein mannosyltransferase
MDRNTTMHHTDGGRTGGYAIWIGRAPLLLAAAIICTITGFNLDRLVRAHSPRDPWEATEVLEAWRSLQGMPVYELDPKGHSTHVYGALVPWLQGEIFRWVGPNNVSGRVLTLASGLVAVTLLVGIMSGERSAGYLAIAWGLLLGVNHRAGQYFAENRPDMTALMLAAVGLLFLGLGQERQRRRLVLLGTACLVVGFFFKQTAAVFAAVPLGALTLRGRRPERSEVALALVPPAVLVGTVVLLRMLTPAVYYYMIDVPKAFALDWPRTVRTIWELLLDSPLFLVLIAEWLVADQGSFRADSRLRWLLAALGVAIPFSAVSFAKAGGAPNSLLPALLAMTCFCVLRLPRLLRRLERDSPSVRLGARALLTSFLAMLMLMSCFPHLTKQRGLIVPRSRFDGDYWNVVSLARGLPGTVICPEDPTIPLYAKGFAGRNIFSEYDTHLVDGEWPAVAPAVALADFPGADYVVDVSGYWQDLVRDPLLRSLGFEPVRDARLDSGCYHLWRRIAQDGSTPARGLVYH